MADKSSARSDRSVKVVRIIDRLNIGGPTKHVSWLAAELEPKGFDTTLITGIVPPGEGDMTYFVREQGVEPVIIKEMSRELGLRDVIVIAKLLSQFLKIKPDIIHTHKSKAGAAGRIAAMIYRWFTPSAFLLRPRECRIVHTYHGHIFHSYYGKAKTRLFICIENLLARLCTDIIIAISEQQRREICEVFKIGRSEQFRVVTLGIDFDESGLSRVSLRQEYAIADDVLLIGIVGRLCEVKNHAMFLEAAALLRKESVLPPVKFVVVGDGHLRDELEQLTNKLGLADAVIFTGFRRDALSIYSDLDIVALTSLNEGTPLTLIEAMGQGRAVVSTEVGGVIDLMGRPEATVEKFSLWEHGITVQTGDKETFARALQYLVTHPGLRSDMAERGKSFVISKLSKKRLVKDIQKLYCELLGIDITPEIDEHQFAQAGQEYLVMRD